MNNSYISGSPFRPQMNNSPTNVANNFVNLGNSFAPGSPFVPQANSSPANGSNFVPNSYVHGSPFMPQMNSSPSNCGNNFMGFAPPFRSPSPHTSPGNYDFRNDRSHLQYHNSPQFHSPRFNKMSPYHSQRYSGSSSQSTVSFGNSDKRKINRNRLFEGSYNSSSQQSEISDESYVSAYSSPNNGRNKVNSFNDSQENYEDCNNEVNHHKFTNSSLISPGDQFIRDGRSAKRFCSLPFHLQHCRKTPSNQPIHYANSRSFSTGSNTGKWKTQTNTFEGNSVLYSKLSHISYDDSSITSNYSTANNNRRNKGRHSFRSPASDDSNPGHNTDIRRYIHPSMLEDPWKELMGKLEEKEIQPQKDSLGAASSSA